MSWISKLCETYDNCSADVLKAESEKDLLPIGHTTQKAQIEVTLNKDGEFQTARVLDKEEGQTVIPCTEDSANRTGDSLKPHPLFDKLQYIAGDFERYVPSKTSGFALYSASLEEWVNSIYSHEMVSAIYQYISKGTVIKDLVDAKILFLDDAGVLLEEWNEDSEKPPIFAQGVPRKSFVRFRVEIPGQDSRVWMNEDVRRNFISFYLSQQKDTNLCYMSGEMEAVSKKSAAKIRNTGDKAKLISSNDKNGFTFRGKFTTADEAVTLGYSASQKYVNALKWLIARQGWRNGDQTIVAWGTKNENLPSLNDSILLFGDEEEESVIDTRAEFASRLNRAISGYASKLDDSSNVVVMGLDSATSGRLSITYYRELTGSDFLRRIQYWHSTASWYPLSVLKSDKGKKKEMKTYYTAPSISLIVNSTYGAALNDKLKKAATERLLPCIVDGKPIPYDIVSAISQHASRPYYSKKGDGKKLYKQTLSTACAVIRKYYNDKANEHTENNSYHEVWTVELNEMERDRNYLFGRLLAYARRIEEYALYVGKTESRQTNAERLMLQFRKHPMKTWDVLYGKLLPYLSKFRNMRPTSLLGKRYEAEMNSIIDILKAVPDGFSDVSLSPLYLLGYQSQLSVFDKQIQEMKMNKAANKNENGE